jgi:hypothetical protein
VAASLPSPVPHGYCRRWIEGSDFSLEANTLAVPNSDLFYVLEAGEIRLGTKDFRAATALYETLCMVYWEGRLTSEDLPTRLQAARGLFRHDHEHALAGDLLTRYGDERDRGMVGRGRHRIAFLRRKQD